MSSRSRDRESDARLGSEDADQSARPTAEVTSSRGNEQLDADCRVRRRCSSSSIVPATPPTTSITPEVSSPPPTSLAEANTSAETADSRRSGVFTPCVDVDPTPSICFESQQSTYPIGGTTQSIFGRSTYVTPFGGRTPTRNSHNSERKCSISYIGSNRTSNCEKRRSTSHFGGTVPKTTTMNHCERSRSHFGGTVTNTTTLNSCERSRSYFGRTVPRTTTTTILNTCERSRSHFIGTVPGTTTTTTMNNFERSTNCEKRRSTTHFEGTLPKTPTSLSDCDKTRSTCAFGTARKPAPTTTALDANCARKCLISYIGRPTATSPDVVLDVRPRLGSDQDGHGNNNVPANGEMFPSDVPTKDDADDLHPTHSCRICHDDRPDEPLMSPCRCKGTIAHVHHSCLARWLGQDLTRSFRCELCQYRYPVVEARRYAMLESVPVWVRDPQNRERFCSFVCVSGFITVINLVVYVTAILVMRYTALSAAPDWFVVCMFLFLVLLYLWNLVQCFKDTIFDHWYWWWNNCVNVCLDVEQMMDATKLKGSSEDGLEESGSCDSLQSCHETCAIDLTTGPVRF